MSPLVLLWGPLLAGGLVTLLKQWPNIASGAGVLLSWSLAIAVLLLGSETAVIGAGYSFTFPASMRSWLILAYFVTGLLFLLHSRWPQGGNFAPVGLALWSPVVALVAIRPLTGTPFVLLLVIALLVILIQDDRAGNKVAGSRYLVLGSLLLPMFLIADWMLQNPTSGLQIPAARLLLVGFVILLGGFPFQLWIGPIVAEARPLVIVLIFGLVTGFFWEFAGHWLLDNDWLYEDLIFIMLLRWSGGLAVLLGGLLIWTAASARQMIAPLLIQGSGFGLLLLAGGLAWETAVFWQASRLVGLVCLISGLAWGQGTLTIAKQDCQDPGLGPILMTGYGLMTLLGWPLTIGFSSIWLMLRSLAVMAPLSISLTLCIWSGMVLAGAGSFRYWLSFGWDHLNHSPLN